MQTTRNRTDEGVLGDPTAPAALTASDVHAWFGDHHRILWWSDSCNDYADDLECNDSEHQRHAGLADNRFGLDAAVRCDGDL